MTETITNVASPELAAHDAFRAATGTLDETLFQQAYIGSWPNRSALGDQLLADYDAARYLARLPNWLQRLIYVDGQTLVSDFTRAGHYELVETDVAVHVFDGPLWRERTTCQGAAAAGQYA